MKTGLESLDTGAPKITYSSNEGPKSPKKIQMAMADPLLEEEYEKYVFEMEEQGLQPMSFEEFERQARSGMNEGGVARIGFRFGGGYQGGATNQGGAGKDTGVDRGGASDRREQYSVARTTTPRTQQVSVAPTEIVDDRGTTEQNLNTARAIINAQLQPTIFNKYKNMIPSIKLASRIGLIPDAERKMALARRKGLLRDLYKVNQTGDMIIPEFFDTEEGEKLLRDAGVFPTPFQATRDEPLPPIIPPIPTTTGLDTTDADADATTTASTFTPATDFNEYDVDQANRDVMVALGVDPRMFAADGGRIGYAGGGITDLRQGYFLGKLVKKATRAVKKIAKSPIGKAALAYALTGGLGNLARGSGLGGMFKGFTSPSSFLGGASNIFKSGGLKNILVGGEKLLGPASKGNLVPFSGIFGTGGKFNPFRSIALASSLPLLMPQEEETLDDSTARKDEFNPFNQYGGVVGLRRKALAGNLDPAEFAFMRPEFYAANGGLAENRMAALNELYGVNDDEEQKLSMGGSAGLPPITMASEGADTQSFPDDETTGIPQATPTMPNQMPIRQPMMNPMMNRMNPMMGRGMPMMGRGMPMMARGMPMMGRGMPMMGGRMMAQEGGLMDMGGMEKDYRNEGGFVPIGGQERADDVPARLSKNEFVFTADAVRNAGGGDIDKGAEIMENMMENLEAGGKVSEESQGLRGAREMFATQQRLGEVL